MYVFDFVDFVKKAKAVPAKGFENDCIPYSTVFVAGKPPGKAYRATHDWLTQLRHGFLLMIQEGEPRTGKFLQAIQRCWHVTASGDTSLPHVLLSLYTL